MEQEARGVQSTVTPQRMGGHNDTRERLCKIPNTKQIEKKNRGGVVTRNKYLRRENNMIENSDNDRVR